MSGSDKSSLVNKDASAERQVLDRTISEEEGPPGTKVKKVEVEIEKEDTLSTKEDSQVGEYSPLAKVGLFLTFYVNETVFWLTVYCTCGIR